MRVSAALLLKHLLNRLHPPAPATAHESARLLAELQQSPVPTQLSRAAIRHLDSLLLHPLLETKRAALAHGPPHRTAVDEFDSALRTGTLTAPKLRSIAKHYLHQVKHRPSTPSADKLGHKLAAWLEAESGATKSSFFQWSGVIHEVVPLMYADGLESTVWAWLRSLYQRDWLSDEVSLNLSPREATAFLHAEDILVSEMMRMAIRRGALHDAAAQYVAAAAYRAKSAPTQALTSSYKRISTAILHKRHRHGIEASTFDHILDHAIPFTRDKVVTRSFLQLYHPASASAECLYQDLNNGSFVASWNAWHSKHKLVHAALLLSVLDAAQLSLDQSKSRHAHFFLDLAEKYWPDYLAIPSVEDAADTSIISRLHHARQVLASDTSLAQHQLAPS
ncbi:hypothetical protein DV736_g2621, partial [Chaetothyriales sp. CBS 134916]